MGHCETTRPYFLIKAVSLRITRDMVLMLLIFITNDQHLLFCWLCSLRLFLSRFILQLPAFDTISKDKDYFYLLLDKKNQKLNPTELKKSSKRLKDSGKIFIWKTKGKSCKVSFFTNKLIRSTKTKVLETRIQNSLMWMWSYYLDAHFGNSNGKTWPNVEGYTMPIS